MAGRDRFPVMFPGRQLCTRLCYVVLLSHPAPLTQSAYVLRGDEASEVGGRATSESMRGPALYLGVHQPYQGKSRHVHLHHWPSSTIMAPASSTTPDHRLSP